MTNTTIKLRRSSVPGKVPETEQLNLGEVAINTHDGKMFFKRDANGAISIVELGNKDSSENVLYVSKSGSDDNDGSTLADAYATIEAALASANTGTTIFVKSGDYVINNPVDIPTGVSLVGDNLRTTFVRPQTANNDIFYVNNASYITGFTFKDHVDGAAAVAFNPDGSAGMITTSPYVQNCSSITTTGVGMKIDGSVVSGLRSMVSDAYTQINAGGIGIYLLNKGYAQLVSIFTVACDIGVLAESGGQCSLTNSNCSFGNFGLRSTGVSDELYSGAVVSQVARFGKTVTIEDLSERPKYGDVILFGTSNTYYTVANSTELVSNTSIVTLEEELDVSIPAEDTASFYQRSLITASSITFEFVGTGTDLYNTPRSGAFPDQTQEVVFDSDNGGLVFFTSTDHKGDFRIGSDLVIDREKGRIQGVTFDRSLFAVLTPYILALED
jgi:hypothetical protein